MSSFEELLHKQTRAMRSVERALTNFKKLGQAKMTATTTQNRMGMLKETFLQCQDLDAKLSSCVDADTKATTPYFVYDQFATCEDNYQEALDFMAEVLWMVAPSLEVQTANGQSSSSVTSRPTVHLPKIHLPSFDGKYEEWESFCDRFTSMVINNESLSNVDRLHFLYSSLKGEANESVSHLPVTDQNFVVAWNIITARYENKRRLISTHLNTLFTLPQISSETPNELRSLRDKINISIQMLRNLGRQVDTWSDILVFLGAQKLDRASRKAWESNIGDSKQFPTYVEFDAFLEKHILILEAIPPVKRERQFGSEKPKFLKSKPITSLATDTNKLTCAVCKQSHLIYQCPNFLAKTPPERYSIIRKQKRCANCFSIKHATAQCTSAHHCKECHLKHHTLLHWRTTNDASAAEQGTSSSASDHEEKAALNLASDTPIKISILLSTAWVRVHSRDGRCIVVRALLDQGSAATLITESLAQVLRLEKETQFTKITGIGETQSFSRYVAPIVITPVRKSEPAYSTHAIVIDKLTRYVPPRLNTLMKWPHLLGLNLADEDPMSSDTISLIIGADLYGQLLLPGLRKGSACAPTAQNTSLGWILSGPLPHDPDSSIHLHHVSVLDRLDHTLRKFWELEDLPATDMLTPAEQSCENHFRVTHTRDQTGRYSVKLPFKGEPPIPLGESRTGALRSLHALENRFRHNQQLQREYRAFLAEYESLGHMRRVNSPSPSISQAYYIPHHAIYRQTSKTTHLRVVFNASRRTSNGQSLNDHLHSGPKLQQDLISILLRWRQFQFVYSSDIAKMYRQIRVNEQDLNFQRILWRNSPAEPVEEYQLLTVTYGTTPAPYLALRVLKQLVEDEGLRYPDAIQVLQEQAYVDDFLFGSNSIESLRRIRDQTVALLERGGFSLRKWASNHSALLSDINPTDHGLAVSKSLKIDETTAILGLTWNPGLDQFRFQFQADSFANNCTTKRTILASVAKIFDPIGWITPFVISGKILIQRLWLLKVDWDDQVPSEILAEWQSFSRQLIGLKNLSIPRKVSPGIPTSQSLHGFSDASTSAYSAAVYIRNVLPDNTVSVTLLMAKSRVAPVKTVSIPRLELCAAHLLARLLKYVQTALKLTMECHCWTDSNITLTWIKCSPSRWKTFVANRVATIQTLIPTARWHHVSTDNNPADCASRGISLSQLITHKLWWSGPRWLREDPNSWPNSDPVIDCKASCEEKAHAIPTLTVNVTPWELETRYSSWTKLIRITAYVKRFIRNLRNKLQANKTLTRVESLGNNTSVALNPAEIHHSKLFWLRKIQSDVFPSELSCIQESKQVAKSSPLAALNPYLDSDGLIRARGRLTNSHLPEKAKRPIIVKTHPLLTLLITYTHRKLLHAGPQLLLAHLRGEFWILRARTTIRAVLYKCVECVRERAISPHELMGDLPAPRVTRVERPFVHTGVDYAGPILVRTAPGRGHKSSKAYIAVFVCLTVKAIHTELVSDYSSASFIAAYQRFVSRRGLPTKIYSDNGTTFQGAQRELASMYRATTQDTNFRNSLASTGVAWQFLPPNAPHFGGLWEAAAKSLKHHLKRVIGAHTLTFEELTTVLCRVEACLNSRPLGAMSDSQDDFSVLTPGHFLIGGPLIASPEPSVLEIRENRLSRWQLIQHITERFWKAWQHDYLHTLHQRPKWRTIQNLAKVGQLVLIRHPNLPPSRWERGRIIECHPGDDGLTRVVTVKTVQSQYKRPLSKICFLPVDINAESERCTVSV